MRDTHTESFAFTIRPLSAEDGGGFMIEYPDLPGSVSDGETPEEAIAQGRDAIAAYVSSCEKHGDPVLAGRLRHEAIVSLAREDVAAGTYDIVILPEGAQDE